MPRDNLLLPLVDLSILNRRLKKGMAPLLHSTCVELFLAINSWGILHGASSLSPYPNFILKSSQLPRPLAQLGFVEYLHSLVTHSESSRQEAPMGLRETPLQNGVILRSLLFVEPSSGIGEPSTCRAKTGSPQVWKSSHPAEHLGRVFIPKMPQAESRGSIPQDWARLWGSAHNPSTTTAPTLPHTCPYLAQQQQVDHE